MPSSSGIKAGKAFVIIEAVDKTARTLSVIGQRLNKFGNMVTSIGKKLVGLSMLTSVPAFFTGKAFVRFDDAMKRVESRGAGTAQEMMNLREQAKKLGSTTSYTASQIADLQDKLAQKGFTRPEIEKMTPAVLNLARGGGEGTGEDTVTSANLIATVLRSFSMDAKEATHVSDVLTRSMNLSNLSLESFADAFKYVGPIAHQVNMSLEDTATMIGQLSNVAIEGSLAGTSIRGMVISMTNAVRQDRFEKALFKATGRVISFKDQAEDLRNIPNILFQIGDAIKGLGTAKQFEVLQTLFPQRQIVSATALKEGRNPFGNLKKGISDNYKAGEKTAKLMDSGLGGAFRRLRGVIETLAINAMEALQGELTSLGNTIHEKITAISEWVKKNQDLVVSFAKMIPLIPAAAAGFLAFGYALKAAGTVLIIVAAGLTAISATASLILSPLGLIAIALGIIAHMAYEMSDAFRSDVNSSLKRTQALFEDIKDVGLETFTIIANAVKKGDIKTAMEAACLGMEIVWKEMIDRLLTAWDTFKAETILSMKNLIPGIDMRKAVNDVYWGETDSVNAARKKRGVEIYDLKEKLQGLGATVAPEENPKDLTNPSFVQPPNIDTRNLPMNQGMFSSLAQQPKPVANKAIDDLEKGSVEAAKAAIENTATNQAMEELLAKQLGVAEEIRGLLEEANALGEMS